VILPPVLFLETDAVIIVSRAKKLGFVLNERITAADHFRKVNRLTLIRHLRSEEGLCCRLSCPILITAILCWLMLRRRVELGWHSGLVCAIYIRESL
jgi:hypothetical protein